MVLKALSDAEPSVRFAAAVAAGQMKLVDAYKPLLAMADDPNPQVQAGVEVRAPSAWGYAIEPRSGAIGGKRRSARAWNDRVCRWACWGSRARPKC